VSDGMVSIIICTLCTLVCVFIAKLFSKYFL